MKQIIIFTFFLLTFHAFGQVLTKNFIGKIQYEIQNYSGFITRDSCGDFREIRTLIKTNDFFQMKDSSEFETYSPHYLPTKFIEENNFIKLIYCNTTKKTNDTINQFPLKKGDTIESCENYLVSADSIRSWNSSDNQWYFKEVQMSSMYLSETTNIGDTTITVLGQLYNCYRFEKFKYWRKTFPGPSHSRQIIYLDKVSLLPLREDWFYWFKNHLCIPRQKWFLATAVEIKKIKNGN